MTTMMLMEELGLFIEINKPTMDQLKQSMKTATGDSYNTMSQEWKALDSKLKRLEATKKEQKQNMSATKKI